MNYSKLLTGGKSLTLLGALVLTAGGAMAIDWNQSENLAKGAEVVVSSNPGDAARITDGDMGNRWQADSKANDRGANDFVLINLGELKTFNNIEIKWEASNATKYSVYVSETAIPYAAKTFTEGEGEAAQEYTYNVVDADWLAEATPAATSTLDNNVNVIDLVTLDETVTAQYILINVEEYSNNAEMYGSSIHEVRVADIANANAITSLTVEATDITEGEEAVISVSGQTAVGDEADLAEVENMTVTVDGVAVEGGEGVYSVAGLSVGKHNVEVSGSYNGNALSASASFNVNYNWDNVEKLTLTPYAARVSEAEGVEVANAMAENAADGNLETYYQYNTGWSEGWVIYDLGAEYMIEAVSTVWANQSNGTFRIGYTTEENPATVGDASWRNAQVEGWTSLNGEFARKSNSQVDQLFDAPFVARYIAVRDGDCPNGNAQLAEVYVKGSLYTTAELTEIELTADKNSLLVGDKATVTAKTFDQYGDPFAADVVLTVNGEVLENGVFTATAPGTYEVVASVEGSEVTASVSLEVADFDFEKILASDVFQSVTLNGADEANLHNDALIDFGTDNFGTLHIELASSHHISMLQVTWEGAAAAHYLVTVYYLDGTSYTHDYNPNHPFVAGKDIVDRFFNMAESSANRANSLDNNKLNLNDVKSVDITPLAANSGYGVKLRNVKVYGEAAEGVNAVEGITVENAPVSVYTVAGVCVRANVAASEATAGLPAGLYIVGGKKVVVK